MKRIIIVATFYCFCDALTAQTMFYRMYGAPEWVWGSCGRQTNDGGYIFLGGYDDFGNGQIYIIKTNSSGDTLWTKSYHGDRPTFIEQTNDGGYIIVWGSGLIGLLKIDGSGDFQWSKRYVGETFHYGHQTSDGGYIIAGMENYSGNYSVCLIKTDAVGNTLWYKVYKKAWNDDVVEEGKYARQTSEGGYIIIGNLRQTGSSPNDFFVIKTNVNGDTTWTKRYGGPGDDMAFSGQQTSDGGYILAGATNSFGAGGYDFFIIKINSSGSVQWAKTYGESTDEYACSIQQTSDGGYVLAGKMEMSATSEYPYVIKTDGSGNLIWVRKYFASLSGVGTPFIEQTVDGGYLNTFGSYGINVFKTDINGAVGCNDALQSSPTVLSSTLAVINGSYYQIRTPFSAVPSNINDTTHVYVNIFCLTVGQGESLVNDSRINVFPNPATNQLTIENAELKIEQVEIYNVLGKVRLTPNPLSHERGGEGGELTMDVSSLAPGIYFVKVKGEKEERVVKFVKQ